MLSGLNLSVEAAYAAGELEGLRRAGKPRLVAAAAKAMDRVARIEPFWAA